MLHREQSNQLARCLLMNEMIQLKNDIACEWPTIRCDINPVRNFRHEKRLLRESRVYSVPARRDLHLTIQPSKERDLCRNNLHRSESKARRFIMSASSLLFLTMKVLPAAWELIHGDDHIWHKHPFLPSYFCFPSISFNWNFLVQSFTIIVYK